MNWEHFIYFAIVSVLLWTAGAYAAWKNKTGVAYATTIIGLLVFFSFIVSMWISLERPPLRTMGETRLWYSFFLPMTGIIVYSRWKYKWILSFSTLLALVFICVNLFKPEIHDKTLMPALQSPWFAPHVIVYMFAYAVLGAATVMAIYLLFFKKTAITDEELNITDNLVCVGLAFMTVGMLFGSLWAKEAWVVGSQGDVGSHHLALIPRLYPLSPAASSSRAPGPVDTAYFLCTLADVLVGYQLPAFSPGHLSTHLFVN